MDNLDLERRRLIANAVQLYDFTKTESWIALLQLSPEAHIESVEIFEDEIQLKDGTFAGALLWHVTLQFSDKGRSIITSESLPGRFEGHFAEEAPKIERIVVDISSVFE